MTIKKTLGAIALASTIGLVGCAPIPDEKFIPEYIYGVVTKEGGSIVDSVNSKDYNCRDPTYAIQFKADDGKLYTFQIFGGRLDALNLAINKGTKIRMKKNNFNHNLHSLVGEISDRHVQILESE
ncbi:MAG TPA: hypothetical protein VJB35_04410 [Candidatus Nanoarchaeia archaeon]|nr:hypothetical protein [Candidatus Nanoarchaeia archaeon]